MAKKQKFVVPRVKLGTQGLEVKSQSMELSGLYNDPVFEEFGISIIKEAFIRGITFLDTADVYDLTFLFFLLIFSFYFFPFSKIFSKHNVNRCSGMGF
uniref:NADP-dependent oxidoreductase domain-containing protein n=2 Tax=Manihot esculenta TaxID=3983 RepID=A0A2C9VIC6_MANES